MNLFLHIILRVKKWNAHKSGCVLPFVREMSLIESHSLQKFGPKRKPFWWDILLGMMVHGNGSFTTPIKYLPQKLINNRHFRGKLHTFVAFLMLPKKMQSHYQTFGDFYALSFHRYTSFVSFSTSLWNTQCDSIFESFKKVGFTCVWKQ